MSDDIVGRLRDAIAASRQNGFRAETLGDALAAIEARDDLVAQLEKVSQLSHAEIVRLRALLDGHADRAVALKKAEAERDTLRAAIKAWVEARDEYRRQRPPFNLRTLNEAESRLRALVEGAR